MKRQLILEEGTVFIGKSFGSEKEMIGEVVFNTGMTGYQEILSDPSYCSQIVTLTYPLVGNYGINRDDFESIEPTINGLIVREYCEFPSNFRSQMPLDQYLKEKDIPGLAEIDTRKLTRKIHEHGVMKGRICNMETKVEEVVNDLKKADWPRDQVRQVSANRSFLAYKLKEQGKQLIKIDKWFPLTKKCSGCGAEKKMSLSERTYQCSCGFVLDRDHNSAINIKNEGLRLLA